MREFQDSIGWRFGYFREILRLKQEDFASIFGVPQTSISKIEKEKQKPTESMVKVMEYAFQLNRDWLLWGEGDCFLHGSTQKKAGDLLGDNPKGLSVGSTTNALEIRENLDDLTNEVPGVDELDADQFLEAVEERKDIPDLTKKLEVIMKRGTERQRYFIRRAVEEVFDTIKNRKK